MSNTNREKVNVITTVGLHPADCTGNIFNEEICIIYNL